MDGSIASPMLSARDAMALEDHFRKVRQEDEATIESLRARCHQREEGGHGGGGSQAQVEGITDSSHSVEL